MMLHESSDSSASPTGKAAELIAYLKMEKIPDEGCWCALTYRSSDTISAEALPARYGPPPRVAGSAIYALVTPTDFSAMHRLLTDEFWHFYAGDPLELLLLHADRRGEIVILGPDVLAGQHSQWVVPRGTWMGARPLSESSEAYTLLGNTLAPGFEYADFEIGWRDELQKMYPDFANQVARLTRKEFAQCPII